MTEKYRESVRTDKATGAMAVMKYSLFVAKSRQNRDNGGFASSVPGHVTCNAEEGGFARGSAHAVALKKKNVPACFSGIVSSR